MYRGVVAACAFLLSCASAAQRGVAPQNLLGPECSADGSDFTFNVAVSNGVRTITTTGCPNYDWTDQSTPNEAIVMNDVYKMPAHPKICTHPTTFLGVYIDVDQTVPNSGPIMGTIGVAFDGVSIYSNSDALRRDAYIFEKDTFDECNGHDAADGTYHYHAQVPDECLIDKPLPSQHSTLFGFMADGVPIYGPLGDNGVTPTDLDECNGHVDDTYPFYHYHVTDGYRYPYTVNCLKGDVDTSNWTNFAQFGYIYPCTDYADDYDYTALEGVWVDASATAVDSSPTIDVDDKPQSATPTPPVIPVQPPVQKKKCRFMMLFCH